MSDVQALYEAERDRFVDDLRQLDDAQWASAALCSGWTVRDLTAHLLMPYELSVPGLLVRIIPARLNFDRLADRWARADSRTGPEVTEALSATNVAGFAVPGAGELAPLAHLVIHSEDVRRPLGLAGVQGHAAVLVLDDITRGKHSVGDRIVGGLRFEATDADWTLGDRGPTVAGSSSAILGALNGRLASAQALVGDGADQFRGRLD